MRALGRYLCAFVLGLALLAPAEAAAHPAYASALMFDRRSDEVHAELQLPIERLVLALDGELEVTGETLLARERPALARYVLAHVSLAAADGRAYSPTLLSMTARRVDDAEQLVAELAFTPPSGAVTSLFTLHSDVILHRVRSHQLFVLMRRDFATGTLGDVPEPLGVISAQQGSLRIERTQASPFRGFGAVFLLGVHHIAEGTDHLLFLLMLLVPAPLTASAGRWLGARSLARTVGKTAAVVSSFTLGHSFTLALAALGVLSLPERPVEVAIALSIFVSALHVLRPVFAEREPLVAGLFGLMHGLAFAGALRDLQFDRWTTTLVLLGFNVGIEAMQLAVLLVTMPWLIVLSRTRAYDGLRWLSASFALLAAGGWAIERAFDAHNPISGFVQRVSAHWYVWLSALVIAGSLIQLRAARAASR